MFEFRLINLPDGNQIIDNTLKTPYNSLTALQMEEYIEVDNQLSLIERMKRKERKQAERKQKPTYRFFHKLACACGIL